MRKYLEGHLKLKLSVISYFVVMYPLVYVAVCPSEGKANVLMNENAELRIKKLM